MLVCDPEQSTGLSSHLFRSRHDIVLRQQLIATFGLEEERTRHEPSADYDLHAPADGAKDEAGVKVPALEEAVVDFVDVRLKCTSVVAGGKSGKKGRTISAIAVHCMAAPSPRKPVMVFHPLVLFCTPLLSMTTNATRVMPSMTTAKDMRKPTERQMLQK